jgi:hypothetical protein
LAEAADPWREDDGSPGAFEKYIAFVTKHNGGVVILPMSETQPFNPQEAHELASLDEEILDDEGRSPLRSK